MGGRPAACCLLPYSLLLPTTAHDPPRLRDLLRQARPASRWPRVAGRPRARRPQAGRPHAGTSPWHLALTKGLSTPSLSPSPSPSPAPCILTLTLTVTLTCTLALALNLSPTLNPNPSPNPSRAGPPQKIPSMPPVPRRADSTGAWMCTPWSEVTPSPSASPSPSPSSSPSPSPSP